MPGLIELIATVSSLIIGSSSLASLGVTVFRKRLEKREALEATAEEQVQTALAADNLSVLASQMRRSLAEVSVYQYATDGDVRLQVNHFLEAVQGYIGVREEIESEPPEEPPKAPEQLEPMSPELRQIAQELSGGEVWNALARLRRLIEIILRQIAEASDLDGPQRPVGAGSLIKRLTSAGLIDSEVARDLSYAVAVSNRAVHGIDVSEAEAREAFSHGARALERVRSKTILKDNAHNPASPADG